LNDTVASNRRIAVLWLQAEIY